jgi:23S rRNA pseudouridine2605 synthase
MVDHPSEKRAPRGAGQAPDDGERVAKALARAGVASRREIERLIESGRVALNGRTLDTPAVKITPGDILTVDGAVVGEKEPTRVWRYHKPVGLVTSHNDPRGRPTVFQNLPEGLPRVISVGRLDLNSEGLLLLTNDGELTRALEMPRTGWVRRYRARAYGRGVGQDKLDTLKNGVTVEGVHYGPIEARIDKAQGEGGANLWISVSLTEGKNREVRRVLEHLGLKVNRLIRLAYGPFALGTLEPGQVEEVGPRVIRELLSDFISPDSLPKGDRRVAPPAAKAGAAPAKSRRAPGTGTGNAPSPRKPGGATPAEKPKPVYKAGWARPKKKPAHKPKAQGPKPGGSRPRKA